MGRGHSFHYREMRFNLSGGFLTSTHRQVGSYTNGMDSFLDVVWVVLALGGSLGWAPIYAKNCIADWSQMGSAC